MSPPEEETRAAIHRLYFVERRAARGIAAELRLRPATCPAKRSCSRRCRLQAGPRPPPQGE